ncbi:hypothetical protein RS399_04095 [Bacillus inaquosorum]|uniref:hypothetical protein n=1 Tax=Bacillus inaquosorum TaxID=483913 RepID=UPI0028FC199C|nr:hypothetical protein [Bacillus inaquosorum]WNW25104.1 hypothetical protein RS399_04095 [Bacillus inaquosorum]
MTLEGKVFGIAGKGRLSVVNTGGSVLALEGDIKDLKGNDILVIVSQEGDVIATQKNPYHREFYYDYISSSVYNDRQIGEQYYWGYEYDLQVFLQVLLGYCSKKEFTFNETAIKLFGETVLEELNEAVIDFVRSVSLE